MKKKVIALLMTLAMVLTMAGCGTKEKASDILAKAQEAGNSMKNADFKATMTMKMSSGGETISMDVDMNGTVFVDPMKAKVDMSANMNIVGQEQNLNTTMYMAQNDGKFYTYTNMMGQWSSLEMDASAFEEAMNGYNNKAYMDALTMEGEDNFKVSSVEENGKKLYKLEGKLTGEAMKKMMDSTSALDSLKNAGLNTSDLDGMGDIAITAYIEKDTYRVYKMSMDLKGMMEKAMESAMGAAGAAEEISVEACQMDMTYENWDAAADFEIPAEALEAAPQAAPDAGLDAAE